MVVKDMDPGRKRSVKEHSFGDLVLVKVKGYPRWPAKISKAEDWGVQPNPNKYCVHFFGTGEIAFVDPEVVRKYVGEEKEETFRFCNGDTPICADFGKAVAEIEAAFEEFEELQNNILGGHAENSADIATSDAQVPVDISPSESEVPNNDGLENEPEVHMLIENDNGNFPQDPSPDNFLQDPSPDSQDREDNGNYPQVPSPDSWNRAAADVQLDDCTEIPCDAENIVVLHEESHPVENRSQGKGKDKGKKVLNKDSSNPAAAKRYKGKGKEKKSIAEIMVLTEETYRPHPAGKVYRKRGRKKDHLRFVIKKGRRSNRYASQLKPVNTLHDVVVVAASNEEDVAYDTIQDVVVEVWNEEEEMINTIQDVVVYDCNREEEAINAIQDAVVDECNQEEEEDVVVDECNQVEEARTPVINQEHFKKIYNHPYFRRRKTAVRSKVVPVCNTTATENTLLEESAEQRGEEFNTIQDAVVVDDCNEEEEARAPVISQEPSKKMDTFIHPYSRRRKTALRRVFPIYDSTATENTLLEESAEQRGEAVLFSDNSSGNISNMHMAHVPLVLCSSPEKTDAIVAHVLSSSPEKIDKLVPKVICTSPEKIYAHVLCTSPEKIYALVPQGLCTSPERVDAVMGEEEQDVPSSKERVEEEVVANLKDLIAAAKDKIRESRPPTNVIPTKSPSPSYSPSPIADPIPHTDPNPNPNRSPSYSPIPIPNPNRSRSPSLNYSLNPSSGNNPSPILEKDEPLQARSVGSGTKVDRSSGKKGATDATAYRDSFEEMIETLTRAKESIGKATRLALTCAKHGIAREIIEIIIRKMENESNYSRKVDLFFLVDSITQCSHTKKGIAMECYIPAVQDSLHRILKAAAPAGRKSKDNRSKCMKVFGLWLQRGIFPTPFLMHFINAMIVSTDDVPAPARVERIIEFPIRRRELEDSPISQYTRIEQEDDNNSTNNELEKEEARIQLPNNSPLPLSPLSLPPPPESPPRPPSHPPPSPPPPPPELQQLQPSPPPLQPLPLQLHISPWAICYPQQTAAWANQAGQMPATPSYGAQFDSGVRTETFSLQQAPAGQAGHGHELVIRHQYQPINTSLFLIPPPPENNMFQFPYRSNEIPQHPTSLNSLLVERYGPSPHSTDLNGQFPYRMPEMNSNQEGNNNVSSSNNNVFQHYPRSLQPFNQDAGPNAATQRSHQGGPDMSYWSPYQHRRP